MPDEAAFAAAVAASPDDDLPRLVFADWLDDQGEPDRAEFVRAQVQCAATPAWEPFAVYCRHRRPEWTTGDPWRMSLPWVQGWAVEWHPDRAFRRGFGYSLLVRDMTAFLADAPRLFDAAPIGELHLPTATLDQWRSFGRAKWLPRVKSVHFYGTTTPIEPVRVLCESSLATGIEEIVFEVCSRPGMPVVLEGLFASELGRRLKSLELRSGPENTSDILNVLSNETVNTDLESIRFRAFHSPPEGNYWFQESPLAGRLKEVSCQDCPHFVPEDYRRSDAIFRRVEVFQAEHSELTEIRLETKSFRYMRMLGLANNPFREFNPIWLNDHLGTGHLRVLKLQGTRISDRFLNETLIPRRFWPNLTELDLRDNRITDAGAKQLLAAPVPPDLTALLLGGNPISDDMRTKLRRHFGPAVLFAE